MDLDIYKIDFSKNYHTPFMDVPIFIEGWNFFLMPSKRIPWVDLRNIKNTDRLIDEQ